METIALGIVLAVGAVVAVQSYRMVNAGFELDAVVVTDLRPNSDESAVASVLELLEGANSSLLMYDDGETTSASLYQDRVFVKAAQAKLDENLSFTIKCMLNERHGETEFEKQFRDHDRVKIYGRRADPRREHYKIADGQRAYVSRHEPGSSEREAMSIDCSAATERAAATALSSYTEDFKTYAVA